MARENVKKAKDWDKDGDLIGLHSSYGMKTDSPN